jgi:hypothetical protein
MASERQLAANRRNARKSIGPRSGAGRKRASRNAYRHGLTWSITSTAAFAKQLDKLVRKIAGNSEDVTVLERARAIAQAELELARVRRAKLALIERASAFGEVDPPQLILNAYDRGGGLIIPKPAWSRRAAARRSYRSSLRSSGSTRRRLQPIGQRPIWRASDCTSRSSNHWAEFDFFTDLQNRVFEFCRRNSIES